MHPLEKRIRNFDGSNFEALALDIFQFQFKHVPVYRDFCNYSGRTNPTTLEEIPFLPIHFFKSHGVLVEGVKPETVFKSSGTGGNRSTHFIASTELYKHTFRRIYASQIGNPKDQVILALLPNYLEQGESSLVYMVDELIQDTASEQSGFLLNEYDEIVDRYRKALNSNKQVVIFGVSYALLDLAERSPDLAKAIIIETGGMKGRRKEMTKAELHHFLKRGLNCTHISSEYGMTELLSQGYSRKDGLFVPGSTMKVLIREVNDPYNYVRNRKTGGINIIDLANLYSCSFVETQDLGKLHEMGFEIMGRFDHSDVRGCNLMIGQ
ncbi:MAG: acyl transferase [Fluviicola sp.]